MADLAKLKRENRIEELIEEMGYMLERREGKEVWVCQQDPDLVVDARRQIYTWSSKGERGDVIDWVTRRLDWPMAKAISYLTNRLEMAVDDRPHWPSVGEKSERKSVERRGKGQVRDRSDLPEGLVRDERLAMVRWLGKDFPGGIDQLFACKPVQLVEKTRWVPRLFLPMHGYIHEASEYCVFCMQDIPRYSSGGAFLSIRLGENYEILMEDSGVYCRRCVNSFERWLKAVDLLLVLIREGERGDVRGGILLNSEERIGEE